MNHTYIDHMITKHMHDLMERDILGENDILVVSWCFSMYAPPPQLRSDSI